MSLLHREVANDRLVEVRGAGRTRRLYVDGVLHSAWNPTQPLTGAVWDHLALPAFLTRGGVARSALVLGVGGGSALRMLASLARPPRLVGVELDATLLRLARDWFGLDELAGARSEAAGSSGDGLELVHGDADSWLRDHGGERFDLVVDDLFGEQDGVPVRPPGLDDGAWWTRLAEAVSPGGVLVVNFVELADLIGSALCQDVSFRRRFPAAVRFSCPGYANAATALLPDDLPARVIRRRLTSHPDLRTASARRLLRFRVHRLWPR